MGAHTHTHTHTRHGALLQRGAASASSILLGHEIVTLFFPHQPAGAGPQIRPPSSPPDTRIIFHCSRRWSHFCCSKQVQSGISLASGGTQLLAEVDPDEEYNANFPRLCDKVARLRLPEDARYAGLCAHANAGCKLESPARTCPAIPHAFHVVCERSVLTQCHSSLRFFHQACLTQCMLGCHSNHACVPA